MRKPSYVFLIAALGLFISVIGLIAVYNASVIEGFNTFNDRFYFAKQQLNWLLLGVVAFVIATKLNPKILRKIGPPFFLLSLLLMLMVFIPGIGLKLQGARRWLSIGPIRLQPSELLKIAIVLYLAHWLEIPKKLGSFIFLILITVGLVILQSDFGTAAIITSICFGLYFISGSRLKEMGILLAVLILSAFFFIFSSPYRMQRLATFIDPTSDTLGRSYHINQVILGLGSGGMFGVGLGRSRQKYAYLPEAATDSIFAIVGEETGFVGGLVLISLLLSLCLLAFKIAAKARDQHQRLVAVGIALLFSAQTFVNLSSMVALIPLTGVPLPLISYGGSSLITNFISLGILASIARSL